MADRRRKNPRSGSATRSGGVPRRRVRRSSKKTPPAAAGSEGPAGGRAKETTRPEGSSHDDRSERKPRRGARRSGGASRGRKRRPLSRHPEAIRSRRRRRAARRAHREEQGVRDQLRYEREQRRQDRAPRDERGHALAWLGEIRNIAAGVFRCSLSTTEAVESDAGDEGRELSDRQRENMRTPWLAIGRYDPQEPIGYLDLAHALDRVRSDLGLEAAIHPQRLSQIRVVYADPDAVRGEGDSIVSKIGAWEFIVAELVREIGGVGDDDEESLALRYQATKIPAFYVYFSAQIGQTRDVWKTWSWKIR
jgi:hypothetical protein